jgi:hypothetical protein
MKLVIIESPFGKRVDGQPASPAEMERNVSYARAAMRDCFKRGEAPYASHLLYPQIFDDAKPEERRAGMLAGWEWMRHADLVAVYVDNGRTPGMLDGMERAASLRIPVEERRLIL